MIRKVELNDTEAICSIYNYYVENTTITFEEEPVPINEMKSRIESITHKLPYVVYEIEGKVAGYAYATKWKERSAYRYSVETTVYIGIENVGKGIGTSLYKYLMKELKEQGFHTALGGIALPNEASEALHEKLGFEKVAHLKKVGLKFGSRIDVGYWQYQLKE